MFPEAREHHDFDAYTISANLASLLVSRSTFIDFLLLVIFFGNVIVLVSVSKDGDRTPSLFLAVHDLALELDQLGGGMVL